MRTLRGYVARNRRPLLYPSGALRRSFAALAAALTMIGCASPAMTVATLQNGYDYRVARYTEQCQVAQPPADCSAAKSSLDAYLKHLHEAAVALKAGGKFPLQLAAIKADDAAVAKHEVTK